MKQQDKKKRKNILWMICSTSFVTLQNTDLFTAENSLQASGQHWKCRPGMR